ncbi:energy transducer TonB [Sphingomonas sp. SORGH_AS_0879]|uniref:energy transducer TonB n=1 Tax=Sphingomonas sp. SORGH_AS_0879 TaxID=3041790 RepID=UPI0027829ABE|nr:energy transducer TonB [Sphingomonas sp. SORGH_AS_0879]MDQ1229729.1 protein TonB [Sphingomonas sp. SORGH_AS_0879]
MAYTDQKMSGGKVVAIVIVVLIHAALGYAFVTGLAYQYVKKATEKLDTFNVEEPPPPPPPEDPPPPPPEQPNVPPPPTTVVTPPPIVQLPVPAPAVTTTSVIPLSQPTAPPAPPAPPSPPAPPAPPAVSKAAGLRGNPGQYFGPDAYPPSAQREGAEGRVSAKLSIGTDGRVTDCSILSSSGNRALDDATCRISKARVRFTPAQDAGGNPVASSYTLNIRWQLPQE